MNKFGKILLSTVLAASLAVTPVLAAPDSSSIRKSKEASEYALQQLKNDLLETNRKINQLEEDLVQKGEEIEKAGEDLADAQKREQEQYETMKIRIRYMYEEGDTSLFSCFLEAKSLTELLNKAEYITKVHAWDREKLKEYVETKEEIENLKVQLEEQQAELIETQKNYEAEKAGIGVKMQEKESEIANLDEELKAALLQEAAERAAEEARRKAEAEAAKNQNNNSHNNNANNSSNNNTPSRPNDSNESKPDKGNGNTSSNNNAGTGNANAANTIVGAAYSQLGVPYVWGGTTPGAGLDCSGLTQYCHRVAGIIIPRTSGPQGGGGRAVSNPQPGDIVCYPGHVGIYIGGGMMIHAPQPGDVVKVSAVYGSPWYRRYW